MSIGQRGEQVALDYLRRKGYLLYDRNIQVGYGEIDLLLFDKISKCLIFVEVKTRSKAHDYFGPSAGMHYRKKRTLHKVMQQWIVDHDYQGSARTDVVYVIGNRVAAHHQQIFADDVLSSCQ